MNEFKPISIFLVCVTAVATAVKYSPRDTGGVAIELMKMLRERASTIFTASITILHV